MTQVGQAIGKALRASLPYNPDDMFETVRWHLENIKNGAGSFSLVDLVEDLVMPTIFLQLDPSVRRRLLRSSDCLRDLYSELALLVRDCKNSDHSIFKDLPPMQRLDYIKANTKVCDYDTVIALNVKQLGSLLYMRGENELADRYFSYAETILDELFGKNAVVIQNADLYREIGRNALNWDRRDHARQYLNKALDIYGKLHGWDSVEIQGLQAMISETEKESKAGQSLVEDDLEIVL